MKGYGIQNSKIIRLKPHGARDKRFLRVTLCFDDIYGPYG